MSGPRYTWRDVLLHLTIRAAGGGLTALVFLLMPLPDFPLHVRDIRPAAVILALVIWMGKVLYDTFFYDRYRP